MSTPQPYVYVSKEKEGYSNKPHKTPLISFLENIEPCQRESRPFLFIHSFLPTINKQTNSFTTQPSGSAPIRVLRTRSQRRREDVHRFGTPRGERRVSRSHCGKGKGGKERSVNLLQSINLFPHPICMDPQFGQRKRKRKRKRKPPRSSSNETESLFPTLLLYLLKERRLPLLQSMGVTPRLRLLSLRMTSLP
jgi:hypothetical protein